MRGTSPCTTGGRRERGPAHAAGCGLVIATHTLSVLDPHGDEIDPPCEDKVRFCQAADLVRPDRQPYGLPRQEQIRVMPTSLGDGSHRVDERQRFPEVPEAYSPLEVLVDEPPVRRDLLL